MKTILLLISVLFTMALYSQSNGSVSGTITDMEMNGEPLLFASIELKDTPWNAQTNLRGNFEITGIVPGNYTLSVGFPGYKTLELPIVIKEGEIVEVQKELFAKSIDLGSLLQSERNSKAQTATLTSLR